MGFPLHLDTMLRYCQAATIVMNQNKVTIQGMLAAVQGDIDTHPGSPALQNLTSQLSGMSGLQALGSLTGLNPSMLSGLSGLSGLSNISSLTGSISSLNSLMGGMGVNISGLTSAMSGIGVPMGSLSNISSVIGGISNVTGMSFNPVASGKYGIDVMGQLSSLSSAAGGLSNIGSLPGMGSIPGVGSLGNYLNAAQGIMGLGGSMGNLANMANLASGMMGGGSGPGALLPIMNKITIQGKPLVVAMQDKALPDMIGMVLHPICPTDPAQGTQKVSAYGGAGTASMLQGLMNGKFNIQELVKVGQQVMGKISSMTGNGGSGSMALQGMTPGTAPNVGDTIVGAETGATMTVTGVDIDDKYNGTAYAPDYSHVMNFGITDDNGIVAADEHFTGLPSQDYQAEYAIINDR